MNANDLIEKWENETGARATDSGSAAEAGLMGTLARMMGKSQFDERDDFVVGLLIQNADEIERQEKQKQAQAQMFLASLGIDLD